MTKDEKGNDFTDDFVEHQNTSNESILSPDDTKMKDLNPTYDDKQTAKMVNDNIVNNVDEDNDGGDDDNNKMIDDKKDDRNGDVCVLSNGNIEKVGEEKKEEEADGKTDSEEEEEEEEEDGGNDGMPVDVGYSWVICFSVCFIQMLVFGNNRSVSTWFVDIREEFQQSQTVTSLTLSVFSLSMAISSMVTSNVIIKLFPPRVACVIAAALSSLSMVVASQAPHIGLWLACYVCRGLGCGLLLIIPMSLIGYYFKKRRALASSIASMGLVVSNIVVPPMASALRQAFGLRGAMLLMSGIELQMIPLAMLLRPHTSYKKRRRNKERLLQEPEVKGDTRVEKIALKDVVSIKIEPYDDSQTTRNGNWNNTPKGQGRNGNGNALTTNNNNYNNGSDVTAMEYSLLHAVESSRNERDEEEEEAIKKYYYSSSAPATDNSPLQSEFLSYDRNENDSGKDEKCFQNRHLHHQNHHHHPHRPNNNIDIIIDKADDGKFVTTELNGQHDFLLPRVSKIIGNGKTTALTVNSDHDIHSASKRQGDCQLPSSSSKDLRKRHFLSPSPSRSSHHSSQMSIAAMGSLMDVSCVLVDGEKKRRERKEEDGDEMDNGVDDNGDDNGEDEESDEKPTFKEVCQLKHFVDMSLLRLWLFRMLAVFMSTSASMVILIIYIPVVASEAGLSKSEGALLLTIGGSVDLVTRPVIGWLADKKIVSKEKMVAFGMVGVAVLTQFGRYYTTFPIFVMFTIMACLFAGFRANLFHAIVFDYFGPEVAPKVFGLALLCTTVFMAINHPIFGALIDITGDHVASLHYVGGVVAVGALAMMLQPLFARLDKRKEERRKTEKKNGSLEKLAEWRRVNREKERIG